MIYWTRNKFLIGLVNFIILSDFMKSKACKNIIVLVPGKSLRKIYFAIFSLIIINCSKNNVEKNVVVPEIT
ncbi:MAG: hypothetical protein CMC59_04265, partial [Flavobacteriaceae bacterium]|nr:hypothetical protein [Flavobacteriaceae bacterium]